MSGILGRAAARRLLAAAGARQKPVKLWVPSAFPQNGGWQGKIHDPMMFACHDAHVFWIVPCVAGLLYFMFEGGAEALWGGHDVPYPDTPPYPSAEWRKGFHAANNSGEDGDCGLFEPYCMDAKTQGQEFDPFGQNFCETKWRRTHLLSQIRKAQLELEDANNLKEQGTLNNAFAGATFFEKSDTNRKENLFLREQCLDRFRPELPIHGAWGIGKKFGGDTNYQPPGFWKERWGERLTRSHVHGHHPHIADTTTNWGDFLNRKLVDKFGTVY